VRSERCSGRARPARGARALAAALVLGTGALPAQEPPSPDERPVCATFVIEGMRKSRSGAT
jgi:hypothetical protein